MIPMGNHPVLVTVVLVSVFVAFIGMLHVRQKTSGPVRGLLIVWSAYFMLTILPTYLLLRFSLVLPTITLVAIIGEALIAGEEGTEVEGFYPGFLIVTPVILLLLCLLAGIEIALRGLV